LPTGEFDAVITSVVRGKTQKDRPKVVVTLAIEYEGRRYKIKDHIVGGRQRTIRELAVAVGRSKDWAAGNFRLSEQVRRPVRVFVTTENDPTYGWQYRIRYMSNGLGMGPDVVPTETIWDESEESKNPY
jgi:hypothetical protein